MDKLKQYMRYLLAVCIGVVLGLCLSPFKGQNQREILVQTDTIIKEVIKEYGRIELAANTHKLDMSTIRPKQFIWIEADTTQIVYRDSVRYIQQPREYYYTRQDDVEIWHSGIDSRIDSLRYREREVVIKDTYRRKEWRHTFSAYAEAGYNRGVSIPVGIEYTYRPKEWANIGGGIEYDLAQRTPAVYAKVAMSFGF